MKRSGITTTTPVRMGMRAFLRIWRRRTPRFPAGPFGAGGPDIVLAHFFEKNGAVPAGRRTDPRHHPDHHRQNQEAPGVQPPPKPEMGTSRQILLIRYWPPMM